MKTATCYFAALGCVVGFGIAIAAPTKPKTPDKTSKPTLPPYSIWPDSPLHSVYLPVRGGSYTGIESPQFNRPSGCEDQLQLFDVPEDMSGVFGCLIASGKKYTTSFVVEHTVDGRLEFLPSNQYLFMEGRGHAFESLKQQKKEAVSYHFYVTPPIRKLQFAQDGRKVFWQAGYGTDRLDGQGFVRWDLTQNKLLAMWGGSRNIYHDTLSLDGNHLAVVGYDDDREDPQDPQREWKNKGKGWLQVFDTRLTPQFDQFMGWEPDFSKYPEYSSAEEKDPSLKGLWFWRVSNRASRRPAFWGADGRLFYTHEPEVRPQQFLTKPQNLPQIWVADPKTKSNKQVLSGGFDGVPSPDGRFLAFFGYNPKVVPSVAYPARPPRLYLYEFKTRQWTLLSRVNAGTLLWTPDSRTLICVSYPDGQYEGHINRITISPQISSSEEVAVVVAKDPLNIGQEREGEPAITPMHISRNGRYLILQKSEYFKRQPPFRLRELWLQAVNLDDGNVTTLAHATPPPIQLEFSWDWLDMSDGEVAAPLTTH